MLANFPRWPSKKDGPEERTEGLLEGDIELQDKQESSSPQTKPERPKLGFALGGGAARGWSHIGVIRAFVENGISPDLICGTSIGAVVGGCYLAGKLDELEEFARSLSRRRVFGLMDLSIGGSGLIGGQRLRARLESHVGDMLVEDLSRPFAAVATELGTGHEIWIKSGSLAHALRCSYALPGVFEPVTLGGRWLVDGALVNPIPVSVCRALGARVVVAVNLNSDTFGRGSTVIHDLPPAPPDALPEVEQQMKDAMGKTMGKTASRILRRHFLNGRSNGLPGISGVMMDSYNIIQDRIGRSRLAGDPPDVVMSLRLGHLGLFDFHRADEAIKVGYEAGLKALDETQSCLDHIPRTHV
ncbi:patatin-like phospholipase family protein [Pseudovibrio exalbescens]|uniref:patatin-like phospholipase family protein n=1 Tax=Pseudovibrio exalbescens TaxID=197461 RepID=UPI0023672A74|nr:patatin-like phospholipase family protein [Pseudovibrio exalbescens]MDD7910538.1 patatin-like phospholipase family protein [Pseudovibrio exalbescens]